MAHVPPPPDTPKETPMAHGRYAQYNDRAILEHIADEIALIKNDNATRDGVVARHDGQLAELIPLARVSFQRPAMSRPAQIIVAFAAVVASASLLVLAFAAVTLVRTPSASASTQTSETARR